MARATPVAIPDCASGAKTCATTAFHRLHARRRLYPHAIAADASCFLLPESADPAEQAPLLAGLIGWRAFEDDGRRANDRHLRFSARRRTSVAQVAHAQAAKIFAFVRRATGTPDNSHCRSWPNGRRFERGSAGRPDAAIIFARLSADLRPGGFRSRKGRRRGRPVAAST